MGGEMEKGTNQETPFLLPNPNPNPNPNHHPKPLGGGGGGGDRVKRDEWSEGAVSTLLEAYETKWVLRNRAKLKGHDWEDVARYVSSRANCTKTPKTQTQCKNKIESMKKRYRSETAAGGADASSWPLFTRLHLLLRGSGGGGGGGVAPPTTPPPPPVMLLEAAPSQPPQVPPPTPPPAPQNTHDSTTMDDREVKDDGAGTKLLNHVHEGKVSMETDSSTPVMYSDDHEKRSLKANTLNSKEKRKKRRKIEEGYLEVAGSIRWLTEVVVKSERARLETMKEMERMRMEADAKRGEMELKRTEIVANTQLEIARIFAAAAGGGKSVDSSLRIGRS